MPPPSERFYKTGDLVRLRSDGNLDFIGRVDRQIKIRGFRIELEEIEKALQSCAGLKDAVVQMREDPPGQKRLVAYYLPGKQPEPTVSDLLSQLREQLPAYMIPAQFVSLKSLPLTPAGKVDYRALPKPANVRPRMGQRPVEAQTETEQQVGLIWQEVLQIEGLGVRDNFFDLGGDSLLAMQVISRVRDAFGIELPLSRLFDAPTVEGLARRLDSATPDVPNGKELFSTGLPDAGGAPASFSQERLWLLHQMNPKTDAYNMAWALRLKGNLDVAALECALGEVLRRHDVLRTSFRYADGCLMQAIDGEARLEMAATTLEHVPAKQRESKLQQLLALEVRRPFDLAKAPLMRASLFKLSATESALLLVMHHAVSDGWSLAILFKDVQRFYEAFVSGSSPTQPAPALRYADYARWQRLYMSGPLLEREVSYWKQLLSGAPQQVAFPQDPLPSPEKPAALRQSLVFSSKTAQAATRLARSRRATPFMVLLTALAITLKKWTGATDLVIGTVTAGRSRREFEELVGCFINFLPLRLDLRGKETGEQVLLEAPPGGARCPIPPGLPFRADCHCDTANSRCPAQSTI
ncbi:MAG TPA: condensation domain-containing protein [Verrucomicrobiae bacterium]|nr:condensation domain-containing protein [Verrucomicrobiae bacterium]